jgi:site-specific recombinase XerD
MTVHVNELDFTQFAPEFTPESDWGKCLTSYLAQIHRKSNSSYTLEHYRAALQGFFSSLPLKLPHLKSREDVEQFITQPGRRHGQGYGKPVGPGTSNNKLITLHSFYHYAASYGVQGDDGMLYPLFKYLPPTAGGQQSTNR